MNEASKLAQVIREMKKKIQTGHPRGQRVSMDWVRPQVTHDGSTILYSGHEDTHIRGVAIVISKQKANTLLEWEPISDRIMKAHFDQPQTLQAYNHSVLRPNQ